jgi:hypothetical protein
MVKNKKSTKKSSRKVVYEPDSTFFLKLVLYLILGSQWLRIESLPDWSLPIPLGLLIGVYFASHEHFQIDRKIEYALLLVAAFVAFWLPMGIVVSV